MLGLLSSFLDPQTLKVHIASVEYCTGIAFVGTPIATEGFELLGLEFSVFSVELGSKGAEEGCLGNAEE